MSLQDTVRIFATKIYEYRQEMNLSQQELADALGLDNSYVSLLERGIRIPSLLTLARIAEVFGVKPVDLITEISKDDKRNFKQKALYYMITEGSPEQIDKIYRILKIVNEK